MPSTAPTPVVPPRGVVPRRAAAVAGAVAAGLAVWVVGVPVLGIELTARTGTGQLVVGPASVAVAGLAAALAGWGLLALLERYATRPRPAWTVTAVALLVRSLAGPLAQGTTVAAVAGLAGLTVPGGTPVVVPL